MHKVRWFLIFGCLIFAFCESSFAFKQRSAGTGGGALYYFVYWRVLQGEDVLCKPPPMFDRIFKQKSLFLVEKPL
ncbi:hypothetical protein BX070DRAFT_221116 [Coemansia spiralis]|nr:hypothetical protein BX070DRAFT_221116 [Coemansia spiralis]